MAWLQLIRWKNLVIVFVTQLFAWYFIVYRTAQMHGATAFLSPGRFLALAVATVFITAAGYIINDYFDIRIDSINRPGKVVLINKIPVKAALIAHPALNAAALALSAIVAGQAGHYEWVALQAVCTVLLWFYSTRFKRQFVTGNVVVAALTALTILVPVLYEPAMYRFLHQPARVYCAAGQYYLNPLWVAAAYCFFAFMLTWMREVVKDMEDSDGDAREGCRTMPIKLGLGASARFTQLLCGITVMALLFLSWFALVAGYYYLLAYIYLLLAAPLVAWRFYMGRRNTPEHFHSASRYLKIIMALGICSLIVYHLHTYTIICTE